MLRPTVVPSLLLFAIIMSPVFLFADDKAQPDQKGKPAAKSPKSRILFDGKSLENWKSINFGGESDVRVEDGMLVVDRGEPLTGALYTGPEMPKVDYELSLEAQKIDGNDFFLGLTFPVKESYCSLVLGGWGGGVAGLSSIDGFDASENETTDYFSFEKGQWYKVKVRVTDKQVEAWLDDQQIANVDHSEHKLSVRIEMEIAKPLSLCTFQTTAGYRNIKLTPLAKESE